MKRLLLAIGLIIASGAAWSATRTAVLSVPGMTCGACPITVRKALERIAGVQAIAVDVEARTVTVSFEDRRVRAEELTRATAEAGYPATVTRLAP